jgi:dipeptidyl aminopeptidase/acylaminoacyl peptidase
LKKIGGLVKRIASTALALLLCAVSSLAQSAPPPRHPITAEDLWKIQRVSSPALARDGKMAVFSVTEYSLAKSKPTSSLWLLDVASGQSRRLTQGGTDGSAAWSPDGKRIAFVSKRTDDEAPQLYVIAADGGEARRVASAPYGLKAPKWLTNSRLAALTQVIPALVGKLEKGDLETLKKEIKRRKDSPMTAYATENRQYRFWDKGLPDDVADKLVAVDVETGALTDLTPGWSRLFATVMNPEFDVSPDGSAIAMAVNSTPPPYSKQPNLDVYRIPADGSGKLENLTADNPFDDSHPRFSPDGRSIVFGRNVKSTYSQTRLYRHDLATGANTPLTEGIDLSFGDFAFGPDGKTLILNAEDRGRVALFRIGADGKGISKIYGEGTNHSVTARGSALLFMHEDSSHPAEIYALDPGKSAPRRLTQFNDALLAALDLGRTESREVVGANGDRIQMWVTYPPGFDAAKKHPLVQILHGGPHTMARDDFFLRWNPHVFASPGYVVARVNRHGSTGFGEKFAQSINLHWGDWPTADVLAATDELAKTPGVDGSKVAAAGASYGGYLAAWLLGNTDRFRCLVDHSGVNSLIAEYGADDTYDWAEELFGGTPWKDADTFRKHDPITYASNFKTPILVTAGESDYRVPYGNALSLYGVVQAMGVPSRLVVFPNENHWVLSAQNSVYWYYEVLDWLGRYLGGTRPAKPVFPTEVEK